MTAISNGICICMSTRLGGDEFAIAVVEGDTTLNATQVAER
jgi:GGDEF domain-containing protein